MGLLSTTRMLASTWAKAKKRQLEGRPETLVDSGGSKTNYSFDGQGISRSELREVKEIRTSGGVISHLVHAKAMMQFGQGATFEAEEDDAAEWLDDQFNDLDNLLIDIGEDATWFPYSLAEIVETQSGDFSHVELVESWTTMPVENEVGQIIQWEQQIKGDFGSKTTNTFAPDEIASFVLNKSNGRDKTGISEVLRAEDEIQNYKENQETINDALEYLVPHNHWTVGADNSSVIDDNELRRVRNMVNNMEGDTQFITGPGVEHEAINLPKFDLKEITNNDLRQLCVALGVPIELASVISEGLGSGEQSGVRENFFHLEKKAKQRSLGGQFVEQVARIILRDYSPYDHEQNLDLVFQESETLEEKKTVTDAIGDDLTVNERRQIFDYSELDGPEGEDFESPGGGAEEENPLFGSDASRDLQDVEDIDTGDYPEAAQENARMALEAREETGNPNDCGTQVGWERANQLDNGEDLSEDTIGRMAAFERHEDNKEQGEEGEADCGWMMWKAWGGDEGIEWAQSKLDEFEEAREASGVVELQDDTAIKTEGNWELASNVEGEIIMQEDPCWEGYEQVGFKTDENGNRVPNCVPQDELGDSGNVQLADGTPDWDSHYLELFDRVWESNADRNLFQFDDYEVPEFVKNRLRDAVLKGSIFSDIESIPDDQRMQMQNFMIEELQDDRWNIDGIANRLQDLGGDLAQDRAEMIARTELASTVNTAREIGYEERGDGDSRFYWVGGLNDRTTDACRWLINKTNPNHGGEPVPMDELKDLIEEAPTHDDEMQDNLARPNDFVVHPNERKTFVRYVE